MTHIRNFLATTLGLAIALGGTGRAAAQDTMPIPPPPPMLYRMSHGEAPPPPDADSNNVHQYSDVQAEVGLESFADCLVRARGSRGKVVAFVRTVPGSSAYVAAGQKLGIAGCAPRPAGESNAGIQLRIQNSTMRKAAFGAMFRRDFGKAAPLDLAALPPLSLSAEFDGPIDQLEPSFRGYRALGDCVARAAAANVRDLQFTQPGSAAESAQFAQIVPAMQGCLTVDQQVALNKYELRGILAEAIYKLELSYAQSHTVAHPGNAH
jgi:hypothetical protein